jgi:hypothetical protein
VVWHGPEMPALVRVRWEDSKFEFETNMGYIVSLKQQQKKGIPDFLNFFTKDCMRDFSNYKDSSLKK